MSGVQESQRQSWDKSRMSRRTFLRRALVETLALGGVGALLSSGGCGEGGLNLPENPLGGISLPGFLGGESRAQGRSRQVAVGYRPAATSYPDTPPFDPTEAYPEYPYDEKLGTSAAPNEAYALVRDALRAWSPEGYGSAAWNPLGGVVTPGNTVLIKPNFVWESWFNSSFVGLATTHASTLRAVVDYVYRACGRAGKIIVADGTANVWAWGDVVRATRTDKVVEHLREAHGVPVWLLDLNAVKPELAPLIRLGRNSALHDVSDTLYDLHDKPDWHSTRFGAGSYYISPTVFEADVIVSLAKMKVHRMAGISAAMKNLFGIIPSWDGPYGDDRLKDVPHYSERDRREGNAGIYAGNDTVWRTIADLNRIALFSDQQGNLRGTRRRRYIGIVDGLLAGGRDMLYPQPERLGALVIGDEPVSVDAVAARVMGYDHRRIRSIARAADVDGYALGPADAGSIEVVVQGAEGLAQVNDGSRIVTPDVGTYPWKGQVEASDFEGPTLGEVALEDSEVVASLEDPSGVAYARVLYTAGGSRLLRDLRLLRGDRFRGVWGAGLGRGSEAVEVLVEVGDELFNAAKYRF